MSEELSIRIERKCLKCQNGTAKKQDKVVSQNVTSAEGPDGRTGHEEETIDAWFDRVTRAHKRMPIDEDYRKEVARGIS